MRNFYIKTTLVAMAMTISASTWAMGECMPIAEACKKEGYIKNGPAGKDLVKDCLMPVVLKTKTLQTETFLDPQLDACKTILVQKMQNH